MKELIDYKGIKRKIDIRSTELTNKNQHQILAILQPNLDKFNDIIPFVTYILERVEAVLLLARKGKIWDAEIIFRSLLEVFMEFINVMSQGNDEKIKDKLYEFWTVLDEIEQVRDSDKAKEIIKSDRILNLEMFNAFILTDEEEQQLKSKPSWANRNYRVSLKNDWSFSGILINLIKNKHHGSMYEPFISYELLQHYYKLSSHIAHGDGRGLSDIISRRKKQDEYADALNLIHYFKFIKSLTVIPLWITHRLALYIGDKQNEDTVIEDYKKYDDYITEMYTPLMERLNELTKEAIAKQKLN